MLADVHILFHSEIFEIRDFRCRCTECTRSKTEYQDRFSLCFIRKGNFHFHIFRNSLDSFNGTILVNKPGYEYSVTHLRDVPDECTIFSFTPEFFKALRSEISFKQFSFLGDQDLQSVLLRSNAELEAHHRFIVSRIGLLPPLAIEEMVMDLLRKVLELINGKAFALPLPSRLKKNHLGTIEKAKEFIDENLHRDISLEELSRHCYVSPFHFSRIFRTFTDHAPHQYLQSMRLKQAELLLKSTELPVTDIAFTSGFNSIDHFSNSFRKKYALSPSAYRKQER